MMAVNRAKLAQLRKILAKVKHHELLTNAEREILYIARDGRVGTVGSAEISFLYLELLRIEKNGRKPVPNPP